MRSKRQTEHGQNVKSWRIRLCCCEILFLVPLLFLFTMSSTRLTLPKSNLPECWTDVERMNVLYAPFRSRSTNSEDWDYKYTFWKNLIFQCCVHSKTYIFTLNDLNKVFSNQGRSPACLQFVVEEMYRSGELQPLEQFLQKPRPLQSWGEWATDLFIKKPLFWSYDKIKDTVTSPTKNTFINLSVIKSEAENLLESIPDNFRNKIMSCQELLDVLDLDVSKFNTIKLLLHYLLCKREVDIKELSIKAGDAASPQNTLIKFGDIKKIGEISDFDITVHVLEHNEKTVVSQIEELENETHSLISEAKKCVGRGDKESAKRLLRKKHQIDVRITKKDGALHNIQNLLVNVKDARSDAEVVEAYSAALSAFKKSGISADSVIDTMSDLGEALEMHNDIQTSLGQSLFGEDDLDLEKELVDLMNDNATPPRPPAEEVKKIVKPPVKEEDDLDDLQKRLASLRAPLSPNPSVKSQVAL